MADVISKDLAESEFSRFGEQMGLDFEEEYMSAEDFLKFTQHKSIITRAICRGHLVVDEKGRPIYTPVRVSDAKPVTFYELSGADIASIDSKNVDHSYSRVLALLAGATREQIKLFSAMKRADLKVCESIINLFMA